MVFNSSISSHFNFVSFNLFIFHTNIFWFSKSFYTTKIFKNNSKHSNWMCLFNKFFCFFWIHLRLRHCKSKHSIQKIFFINSNFAFGNATLCWRAFIHFVIWKTRIFYTHNSKSWYFTLRFLGIINFASFMFFPSSIFNLLTDSSWNKSKLRTSRFGNGSIKTKNIFYSNIATFKTRNFFFIFIHNSFSFKRFWKSVNCSRKI